MRIQRGLAVGRAFGALAAIALVGAALGVAGGGAAFAVGGSSSALVPYSPDPNAIGTLSFFDSAGKPQSTGSVNDPYFAAYVVASGLGVNAGGTQDSKATLYAFTPVAGVLPANWQGNDQLTSSTVYPAISGAINTTVPGSISGQPNATVTGQVGDDPLANAIDANPNNATNNYAGLYEMRVLTAHPGGSTDPNSYYATDIKVVGTTWTQVNPTPPTTTPTPTVTPTSTALTATPASGAVASTSITLTATESPAAAGSVQFKDGTTTLGSPIPVSAGVASKSAVLLSVGSHSLSAVFTPSDASFSGSTGTLTYSVAADPTPTVTPTSTALTATPASGAVASTSITLTATESPAAAGSVQFKDGTTTLGSPIPVSAGVASKSAVLLSVGSHSLSAVFTPSDASFSGSTGTLTYSVAADPTPTVTPTSTALTATPASGALTSDSITFTATESPAAAGSIQFKDGTTALGAPVVVNGSGIATKATVLAAAGTHALSAIFTPSDPTFSASTGTLSYVVSAPSTSVSLTLSPVALTTTSSVALTGTVTPAQAVGSIQFRDAGVALGAPVTVTGGTATLSGQTVLLGSHSFTASFVPSNSDLFAGSTSAPTVAQASCGPQTLTSPQVSAWASAAGTVLGSDPTLTVGQTLCVTAVGFAPNAAVTVTLNSTPVSLPATMANANGVVAYQLTIPADFPAGAHTAVLASTGTGGNSVSLGFSIAAATTTDPTTTAPTTSAPTTAAPTTSAPASGGTTTSAGTTSAAAAGSVTPVTIVNTALANTGSDIAGGSALGVALLALGTGALIMARRRASIPARHI